MNRVAAFILFLLAAASPMSKATPETSCFECKMTTQLFFDYLLTIRTDIGTDKVAQEKWLSAKLRDLLKKSHESVKRIVESPNYEPSPWPSFPSNDTFYDSWDRPTACEATGYKPSNSNTIVFVHCGWGEATNYPGESRQYTVVMSTSEGAWLIEDIVSHSTEYAPTESTVTGSLLELIQQADAAYERSQ